MKLTIVVFAAMTYGCTGFAQIHFVDTYQQEKKLLQGGEPIQNKNCPEEGGKVVLDAVIDTEGRVVKARGHKNSRLANLPRQVIQAAIQLVKNSWHYLPTFQDGKRTKVSTYIRVDCRKL